MAKSKGSKGSTPPVPVVVDKTVSEEQLEALLQTLTSRFADNMNRHDGLEWAKIQAKLEQHVDKLAALQAMEQTGGEPDVVGHDKETDAFIFYDCVPETPKGRRSICYDREGQDEREKKGIHPAGNAVDIAAAIGIELLTEAQYRALQTLGAFDAKTSSWLKTPPEIRALGGALFADFRYDHVFVYHNSAPSFYASRGFRGVLRV